MEHDTPIHSGFLLLPPAGKLLLKKTWQTKYCLLFKASKFGIERLEIYDNVDTTKGTPTIITLENVIKIVSNTPTSISITLKNPTSVHEFTTVDPQSKNEWLTALQSVAFPDDVSKVTSIEEDNDLYCSSTEGVFNVRILPSPASKRCRLEDKMYTLVLTASAIQLRNDGTLLYTWPYCFVRRYGYKSKKFAFFVAGRMCESGEGTFLVENSNEKDIFKCLASKINLMKKLLRNNDSAPILDCGDNQLHAALSMEARSRSPLPPSPRTTTSLHDVSGPLRPAPSKPPRKSLMKSTEKLDNIITDYYEPIDRYDKVTYRSDAWRTMGVDEIKHTENKTEDEDEDYMSWGAVKKNKINSPQVAPLTKASKIITESTTSLHDNYDKLDFFGSSSKLDSKSGYKQVTPAPIVTSKEPTFNDYDEVQPAFESIRLADDSHLGYALIRKEPLPVKDEGAVNHQFHNNEPYAVISKPKRV